MFEVRRLAFSHPNFSELGLTTRITSRKEAMKSAKWESIGCAVLSDSIEPLSIREVSHSGGITSSMLARTPMHEEYMQHYYEGVLFHWHPVNSFTMFEIPVIWHHKSLFWLEVVAKGYTSSIVSWTKSTWNPQGTPIVALVYTVHALPATVYPPGKHGGKVHSIFLVISFCIHPELIDGCHVQGTSSFVH